MPELGRILAHAPRTCEKKSFESPFLPTGQNISLQRCLRPRNAERDLLLLLRCEHVVTSSRRHVVTSSRRHVVTSSRRQARDVLDHHRIFEPNCPLLAVTCPYPYLQSTKRAKMTTDIDMTNANGAQAVNGVHIDEVRGVGDRLADFSDLVRPPSRAPLSRYSLVCTRACLSSTRTYTLASWRSMARRACVAWPQATC